jgi:tRNA(fMet)-specific endonuclease VapC
VRFLLDTDHISFLQRGSGSEFTNLTARIAQHSPADFALSVVSFHEQVLGAHSFINCARTPADVIGGYTLLLETLQGFSTAPVLAFDEAAIVLFNELRVHRVRVSTMDLRIAAIRLAKLRRIALSQNLVLLTRNLRDFERVPGLVTKDWTI